MIVVLAILAAAGVVGLLDVTFFGGQIGVKISDVLPWTRKD